MSEVDIIEPVSMPAPVSPDIIETHSFPRIGLWKRLTSIFNIFGGSPRPDFHLAQARKVAGCNDLYQVGALKESFGGIKRIPGLGVESTTTETFEPLGYLNGRDTVTWLAAQENKLSGGAEDLPDDTLPQHFSNFTWIFPLKAGPVPKPV